MCINEAMFGHEVAVYGKTQELHRVKALATAALGLHWINNSWLALQVQAVAMSMLHYSYVTAVATAAASASREAMLWLLCQSERINVSQSYGFESFSSL